MDMCITNFQAVEILLGNSHVTKAYLLPYVLDAFGCLGWIWIGVHMVCVCVRVLG